MSSKIRHKRNLVGHQRTQYAISYICDQRDYYDKCSWDIEHILAHTSEHTLVRNHIHVTCVTSFFKQKVLKTTRRLTYTGDKPYESL